MQFECIFSWGFAGAPPGKAPPQSLRDSSPKGAPFGAAVKFSATAKAVPLGKVA